MYNIHTQTSLQHFLKKKNEPENHIIFQLFLFQNVKTLFSSLNIL